MEPDINNAPDLAPEKLIPWLDKMESFFNDIYDKDGKFVFDKAFHVATFTLGRVYSLLNRNLFQQKNILAQMEEKYSTIRRGVLIEYKKTVPYDLGAKGEEIYLNGNEIVSKQAAQIKMQKNLIEYVEHIFSQASYYNGNLKSLVESQEKWNRSGN